MLFQKHYFFFAIANILELDGQLFKAITQAGLPKNDSVTKAFI